MKIKKIIHWLGYCKNKLSKPNGRWLLVQERRMRAEVQRVLIEQMNEVLKIVQNLPRYRQNQIQKNSNDKVYLDLALAKMTTKTKLVGKIISYAKPTLKKGGDYSVKELKLGDFGIKFDLKHPQAVKWLQEKQALQLSDYKGSISATTNNRIKEIVSEGLERGASYSELATKIRKQAEKGVFSRARAQFIASREMGEAYENGRKVVLNDFISLYPTEQVWKIWQTVGDNMVTPECEANEAEGWIMEEENWSSGDDLPPRHDNPRCRCTCSRQISNDRP